MHVALVENRAASGSHRAVLEAHRLAALFRSWPRWNARRLVLFLDSAGAKVSEGLKALGAFRALYRAGLEAALSGAPIAAVLGKNCYGGSSMLAHLARTRLFSPTTRLAMSGPAVIAAGSGMDPLDEMFRAMAEAAMSPPSRAKTSGANSDVDRRQRPEAVARRGAGPGAATRLRRFRRRATLALAETFREARGGMPPRWKPLQPPRPRSIYPGRLTARAKFQGLHRRARAKARTGAEADLAGMVGDKPLAADRAWRFAEAAWKPPTSPA